MTQYLRISAVAMAIGLVGAGVFISRSGAANSYHLTDGSSILTMEQCLNCHDASSKMPIYICTGTMCLYSKSHSLMRPYPPTRRTTDYSTLAEITEAGCVLEGGKTTCLSCHDLTKPAPHLVREGDALCYICHKNLRPTSSLKLPSELKKNSVVN
jgi:hypothetical protein